MSAADLSRILYEHLPKGDPVDVANLSMMLHQNGQQIVTPPAEPVVEATARNYVADKETYPRQITFADGRIVRLMTDFANGIHYLEVGSADARAALAAKDGRS